ncbi:hypothetical protein ACWKSP_01150 [Micromonosporaceae bacterium Da 78-11]
MSMTYPTPAGALDHSVESTQPLTDDGGTGPRARARQAVTATRSAASRVRAVAPERARQAGVVVRGNPAPVATGALAVVGATVLLVLRRRRAAQARAARSSWRPAFLKR